jgi:hypothetical protein
LKFEVVKMMAVKVAVAPFNEKDSARLEVSGKPTGYNAARCAASDYDIVVVRLVAAKLIDSHAHDE